MSKAIKIKVETNFDFLLIGLVTSEPIYKISWQINEKLSILLKEANPLQVYHQKKQLVQEFTKFSFIAPDNLNYHLLQNKGSQGFLIEEQKQVDFWLKIEDTSQHCDYLIQILKTIKNISLALKVEPGSLKSKSRLIFTENEN